LEEHDLLVLEYRLPTEAIEIEFLRGLYLFNSKGHYTDALVYGAGFFIAKGGIDNGHCGKLRRETT
jgi:hypothetical protein